MIRKSLIVSYYKNTESVMKSIISYTQNYASGSQAVVCEPAVIHELPAGHMVLALLVLSRHITLNTAKNMTLLGRLSM